MMLSKPSKEEHEYFSAIMRKNYPAGALAQLNITLNASEGMQYAFHKENPTYHTNPPTTSYQMEKYGAFTILETEALMQECIHKNGHWFYKYILLFHVLQHDKIGWVKLTWSSRNTDAIIKIINKKLIIISQ